jgi:DNA invertase Pin-like site-specific DNA recombinase
MMRLHFFTRPIDRWATGSNGRGVTTRRGRGSARTKGRLLGRPKGVLGKSKLDGKEEEFRMLLGKEVSKASIAKIVSVSRTALHHFIRTRKLDRKASQRRSRVRPA